MNLCYTNNPNSLFRKYAKLVTWFANTNLGRDYLKHDNFYIPNEKIGLLLPNGYIKAGTVAKDKIEAQLVVTTRATFAPKIYPALQTIDLVSHWIRDFDEAKELLAWYLGLRRQPLWASQALYVRFAETTFNPNAHPESTSVDGQVYRAGGNESYATCRSSAGTYSDDSSATFGGTAIRHFRQASNYDMSRFITLFDTSALTAAAVISAATASHYGNGKNIDSGKDFNINLLVAVPASNTALVASDYNIANWTMTLQSDTQTSTSVWNTAAYNDFPLNSTGLGNISKTGITKFGWSTANDRTNTDPSLSAGQDERIDIVAAEGSNKPKLVVTYTIPSSIKKVSGVSYASLKKICGISIASVKKVAGIA
jgi:hypothetical protein